MIFPELCNFEWTEMLIQKAFQFHFVGVLTNNILLLFFINLVVKEIYLFPHTP